LLHIGRAFERRCLLYLFPVFIVLVLEKSWAAKIGWEIFTDGLLIYGKREDPPPGLSRPLGNSMKSVGVRRHGKMQWKV
jgi:hypothetical protein